MLSSPVLNSGTKSCAPGCYYNTDEAADYTVPRQEAYDYDCKKTEYNSCDCQKNICWFQPDNWYAYCSCYKDPATCGKGCSGQATVCPAKQEYREVNTKCSSGECNPNSIPSDAVAGSCNKMYYDPYYNCISCPLGKWAPSGTVSACSDCPAGKAGTIAEISSAASCSTCTSGTYSPADGATFCSECVAGTYQDESAKTSCKVCSAGKYQSGVKKDNCDTCPSGKYIADDSVAAAAHDSSSRCQTCPQGKFNDGTGGGLAECPACPVGKKSKSTRDGCDECPDGFYAWIEGLHYCAQCQDGKYSNDAAGHATCTDAPDGGYAFGLEQGSYTICPAGKYSKKADSDTRGPLSCTLCPAGTYLADDGVDLAKHNDISKCLTCEAGMIAVSLGSR